MSKPTTPTSGGRYQRDPRTGALSQIEEPTLAAPKKDAPVTEAEPASAIIETPGEEPGKKGK
ncbi:hypothetical protein [Pararhizobium sp.]|uniref:hypothetical protein n=1 Tax=Pararhizobium sp. TaxID=1977563 RepID=UPI003D107A66